MYICSAAEGWNHTRPDEINGFSALYPIQKKGKACILTYTGFFMLIFSALVPRRRQAIRRIKNTFIYLINSAFQNIKLRFSQKYGELKK
jgi:hypothetical protein